MGQRARPGSRSVTDHVNRHHRNSHVQAGTSGDGACSLGGELGVRLVEDDVSRVLDVVVLLEGPDQGRQQVHGDGAVRLLRLPVVLAHHRLHCLRKEWRASDTVLKDCSAPHS